MRTFLASLVVVVLTLALVNTVQAGKHAGKPSNHGKHVKVVPQQGHKDGKHRHRRQYTYGGGFLAIPGLVPQPPVVTPDDDPDDDDAVVSPGSPQGKQPVNPNDDDDDDDDDD